ncbi:MAG TPA: hypothetical protein VGR93_01930 [Candidatus Acidoferrales bacterium]|nr:hypothetical protein [Candidatus Acidoferrales bacterium]
MKLLRLVVPLIFILPAVPTLGQQATGKQAPVLCRLDSLPSVIQRHLREEYGSWKIQEASNLSPRAKGRWVSEKPLECPGIAIGHFESAQTLSYALLLVPLEHADAGYRFVVFSQKPGQSDYEARILDKLDESGATNYFLRAMPIGKFFDEPSKKRFHAHSPDVILLFDSAENEYEVDVYYWSENRYRHDPVDY